MNTTEQPAQLLESKAKIRFQDCDPFNHLNNAKYIDYMINAREDQILEAYGLDIFEMAAKQGLAWVVGSNQIAYFKPANTMEEVLIESQLIQYSARHLQVEIRMWDKEKRELKALLWSSFVHYNLVTKRAGEHHEDLMQLFEAVALPVAATSFGERSQFFRLQKEGITVN